MGHQVIECDSCGSIVMESNNWLCDCWWVYPPVNDTKNQKDYNEIKAYNLASAENQPCDPEWHYMAFVGKCETEQVLFYVYYDLETDQLLDFPDPLEEKQE